MTASSSPAFVPSTLKGWKAARILSTPTGVWLSGAAVWQPYGVFDLAQCVHVHDHVPPRIDCSCGFYAWNERELAAGFIHPATCALLEVELWGRFEEFEHGFIAAAQRVVAGEILGWCSKCFGETGDAVPAQGLLALERVVEGDVLGPACVGHMSRAQASWRLRDVAEQLGAPLRWERTSDPRVGGLGVPRLTPPPPPVIRRLDELLPTETAYVFPNVVAATEEELWIDPLARLVQPLPGTDIPIRLDEDGVHELLLDEVTLARPWRPRDDRRRFCLPVRPVGQPRHAWEGDPT